MKTWLITGCSSGIGQAIAKKVLQQGDQAIITARESDYAQLQSLTDAYPNQALGVVLELTDHNSIKQAIKQGQERFGSIDILVNNAGRGFSGAVEEGDLSSVEELFQTNFFGPVQIIKEVLPDMRANQSGAIINISSLGVITCDGGSGYYVASKAALEKISIVLRKEVESLGIKVMVVEPGPFRTNFRISHVPSQTQHISDYAAIQQSRDLLAQNPFSQNGDPNKAAQVIVEAIAREDYPKIIVLGKGATDLTIESLKTDIEERAKWKTLGDQTHFDE